MERNINKNISKFEFTNITKNIIEFKEYELIRENYKFNILTIYFLLIFFLD